MADDSDRNPLAQLVELFVYAPVGLIYEYPDVLPKLIRRGKSQVQLAKVLGQMAANQGKQAAGSSMNAPGDHSLSAVVGSAAVTLARGITDFGELVGLAPATSSKASSPKAPPAETSRGKAPKDLPLPIADYDNLPAKRVIACVGDLTPSQQARVRSYEETHKNRKTVLAKLARLADG